MQEKAIGEKGLDGVLMDIITECLANDNALNYAERLLFFLVRKMKSGEIRRGELLFFVEYGFKAFNLKYGK